MRLTYIRVRVSRHALTYLCLLASLTLSSYSRLTDESPSRPSPRPLPFLRTSPSAYNDPVRFTIRCEKPSVRVGESFDLIITAELLNISPHLMFFLPGSNAFRLRMLLPPGFEQTGGDFVENVGAELSFPARPVATYRLTGHFTAATPGTRFRLLRSYGPASDQNLYVEKAALYLKTRPGAATSEAAPTLLVTTEPASARARVASPTALTVLAPSYDCNSGAITFRTAGGDGTTIRYMAVGITGWTTDPNQYLDAGARTNADVGPFTIQVEQSGVTHAYVWSRQEACSGTPPPTAESTPTPPATANPTPPAPSTPTGPTALTVLAPSYDCNSGAITFRTAGGDGTTIRYMAVGITGWTTDPNQYLDAGARTNADVGPFTIQAEQSGTIHTYVWSRQEACSGTPPPTNPPPATPPPTTTPEPTPPPTNPAPAPPPTEPAPTPPAPSTPTAPTALTVLAPSYDCNSGAITFRTAGGDGTTIRYMAVGITGWTTDPNQYLDANARTNADVGPFTIQVEQSGVTHAYVWSRQEACSGTPPPTNPPPANPNPTPPPTPAPTPTPPPTNPAPTPAPTAPASTTFSYQIPSQESPWMGFRSERIGHQNTQIKEVSHIENNQLKIEVRRGFGCSIQIYDKVTNQALINFLDQGRESGMSSYGGPKSFSDDAPFWRTGYNPLQAGDSGGNPATLLFHGFVTIGGKNYIYTKTQQNSWAHHDNRMLQFFYEQWVTLSGNKVHVYVRLTHRNPDKTFYNPEFQEWPMMMINGSRIARFYTGDQPFTYAGTTGTDGVERRNANGSVAALHQLTPFIISEPWMGVEIGTNRMIGLVTPDFYHVNYNYSDPMAGTNYEGGPTIMYVCNQPFVHLDSDNVWHKEYTYVVGTEREVREFAYAQYRNPKIDFPFKQANGRNGWFIQDGGYDQKEPFASDNWRVTFQGKADPGHPHSARGTKLRSPYGSWKASDNQTIYIRMKYSGPENQLRLSWLLAGQEENGLNSEYPNQNAIRAPKGVRAPGQHLSFNVIKDGQFHTYALNVSANSTWKDIVQQLDLEHVPGGIIDPGEQFEISYIGATNPGQ